MKKELLADIKNHLAIFDAWVRLGLEGIPGRINRSPFREDKSPSFAIFADGARWKDHGTNEGGDVVDFIAKTLKISVGDAIVELRNMVGGGAFTSAPKRSTTPTRAKSAPDADKLALRMKWRPEDTSYPTPAKQGAICKIRSLPAAPVEIAAQTGILRIGRHTDNGVPHPSYVVTSPVFQQHRRLDGEDWTVGKCWNRPGGDPSGFIGFGPRFHRLEEDEEVLLLEGALSWIEGIAAQWMVAPLGRRFAVLAAISANVRFKANPDVLQALTGRRVTIIPDRDEAGEKALSAWKAELTGAGSVVRVGRLPEGFKDLGPLLARGSDAIPSLVRIFQKGGDQ